MNDAPSEKRFVPYLNIMRAVAIALVLIDHCVGYFMPGSLTPFQKHLFFSGDATLFFMVSGVLILPVRNGDTGNFLLNRFLKFGVPFALWLLVYFFAEAVSSGNISDWNYLSDKFRALLFVTPFPEGWFFYVLFGLYLFAPVISVFIRNASRRQIEYLLLLWFLNGMALLLPYLRIYPHPTETILGAFYGYSGFMVLGWYLHRYPLLEGSRIRAAVILGISVIVAILPIILPERSSVMGWEPAFTELAAPCIGWSIVIFTLIQSLAPHIEPVARHWTVRQIVKISFLTYIGQGFIMRYIIEPVRLSGALSGIEASLLAIFLSLLLAQVLSSLTPRFWRTTVARSKTVFRNGKV